MSAEAIKASYRRMLALVGEPVAIRRYTGAGPNRPRFDVVALARVTDYAPDELVGSIQQGDRKVILLVEDLVTAQFPLPLAKGDKVVIRGRETNIEAPDDNSRRVGNTLVAYELRVRG